MMRNKQSCILRRASMEDAQILFQWKNDKEKNKDNKKRYFENIIEYVKNE